MEPSGTCCFTGHRPNHLPWGKDETHPLCVACKEHLAIEIELAYLAGFRRFLCGMAMGGDLLFAETVLAFGEVHPDLWLEAVIPCLNQTNGWPQEQAQRYQYILEQLPSDRQILIQPERTRGCMLRRDRYMVNQSQRIIALYDGKSTGGTRYTLSYALKKELEAVIIDPYTMETIR
ncbi:MAG: DUF1273 domain-containing protein [Clostridiales bacterium]|nr:DUF1273 domain-containing protein [Clostridiales bacterium]